MEVAASARPQETNGESIVVNRICHLSTQRKKNRSLARWMVHLNDNNIIGAYGDQLNSVDSTEFSKVSIRTNQSITMMNPPNLRGLSYKCIKEYWRERWS